MVEVWVGYYSQSIDLCIFIFLGDLRVMLYGGIPFCVCTYHSDHGGATDYKFLSCCHIVVAILICVIETDPVQGSWSLI